MLNELLKLAAFGLPGVVSPKGGGNGKPQEFTIRIPENHPKADQLVRLFKFLETRVITESGIEIKRSAPVPNPAREFLSMLRDVVEDKASFDQALAQIEMSGKAGSLAEMGLLLNSPSMLATVIERPLAQGLFSDRVEHQEARKWAERAVKKLRRRS